MNPVRIRNGTATVSEEVPHRTKVSHWDIPRRPSGSRRSASQETCLNVFPYVLSSEKGVGFYLQKIGCSERSLQLFLFSGGTMDNKEQTLNPTEQAILKALRELDYGEIVITVHNGTPTIMEVSKKIKF